MLKNRPNYNNLSISHSKTSEGLLTKDKYSKSHFFRKNNPLFISS